MSALQSAGENEKGPVGGLIGTAALIFAGVGMMVGSNHLRPWARDVTSPVTAPPTPEPAAAPENTVQAEPQTPVNAVPMPQAALASPPAEQALEITDRQSPSVVAPTLPARAGRAPTVEEEHPEAGAPEFDIENPAPRS